MAYVIKASADDLGPEGFDHLSGHGRINARRALEVRTDLEVKINKLPLSRINLNKQERINFYGTASGAKFKNCQLMCRRIDIPEQALPITDLSPASIEEGSIGSWDIRDQPPGDYVVSLVVNTIEGEVLQDNILIELARGDFLIPESTNFIQKKSFVF